MICQNLPCRSPHRTGYFFAGPALQGTVCGDNKVCFGGECVEDVDEETPPGIDGWTEWSVDECSSGCLLRSKGFQKRHRSCLNSAGDCEGLSIDLALCGDREICAGNRYSTAGDHATNKCRGFSEIISELDGSAMGMQAPYEEQRLWVSCAIFCRRGDSSIYFSPRSELNDLGSTHDAYFPDGTHCHNDGAQDYYCLHHHCLPENFEFTRGNLLPFRI